MSYSFCCVKAQHRVWKIGVGCKMVYEITSQTSNLISLAKQKKQCQNCKSGSRSGVQQSRTRLLQSAAHLVWEVHGSNLDPTKSFQIFSAIKFCAHFCWRNSVSLWRTHTLSSIDGSGYWKYLRAWRTRFRFVLRNWLQMTSLA